MGLFEEATKAWEDQTSLKEKEAAQFVERQRTADFNRLSMAIKRLFPESTKEFTIVEDDFMDGESNEIFSAEWRGYRFAAPGSPQFLSFWVVCRHCEHIFVRVDGVSSVLDLGRVLHEDYANVICSLCQEAEQLEQVSHSEVQFTEESDADKAVRLLSELMDIVARTRGD